MANVLDVNNDNFKSEVIESDVPVLVDFWAPWCGPCRMVGPILEEIAGEGHNLKIVKVNVDENPDLSASYRITSIPALKLFKNGDVVQELVGAMPKPELLNKITPHI